MPAAHASVGDRSPAYHRCLNACARDLCDPSHPTPPSSPFYPYPSSTPLWSCPSTCSYACQSSLTDLALSLPSPPDGTLATQQHQGGALEGLPVGQQVQFHGKWPFHRLDLTSTFPFSIPPLRWVVYLLVPSAQEPLSVLFSLGNLWAHYEGLLALQQQSRSGRMIEGRTLARVYALYAYSGLNAWTWSAVFHVRDVPWTEKADYFSAALTLLVGLWSGVVRVQGWYAPLSRGSTLAPSQRRSALLFTAACAGVYSLHLWYLTSMERFNYAYNMQFNVVLALSTIALWALWTLRQSRLPSPSNFSRRQLSSYPSARARFRAPHYLSPLLPLVALPALTALELLDFPPLGPFGLRLLDAHALWHLSTIAVVRAWYGFLVRDVRWIDGQGEGGNPSGVLPGGSDISSSSSGGGTGTEGRAGEGAQGVRELALAGAALAKRRMTGLGAGLGLGLFGMGGGGESRRGSLANLGGGGGAGGSGPGQGGGEGAGSSAAAGGTAGQGGTDKRGE
ncbi:hypothetical protein JCM8547_005747 [Rhodosporidiobolus lusitaniae]